MKQMLNVLVNSYHFKNKKYIKAKNGSDNGNRNYYLEQAKADTTPHTDCVTVNVVENTLVIDSIGAIRGDKITAVEYSTHSKMGHVVKNHNGVLMGIPRVGQRIIGEYDHDNVFIKKAMKEARFIKHPWTFWYSEKTKDLAEKFLTSMYRDYEYDEYKSPELVPVKVTISVENHDPYVFSVMSDKLEDFKAKLNKVLEKSSKK